MNRPAISIVIPVYQSSKYLPYCMDSILAQSFADWELILVDDGSSDGSERLCDDYAQSSESISAVHQNHAGLSAARNTGLDLCSGEYVAMIDSDDVLLDQDYLLLLYKAAMDHDAGISMCGHAEFPDGETPPDPTGAREVALVISGEDAFCHNIFPEHFHIDISHGKLFHHERFRGVRYPVGRNMEDSFVMHRLAFPCKRIAVVDSIMYGHRNHSASVVHSVPIKSLLQDLVYGLQDRIRYFESVGRTDLANMSEQKLLQGIMNQNVLRLLRNSRKTVLGGENHEEHRS